MCLSLPRLLPNFILLTGITYSLLIGGVGGRGEVMMSLTQIQPPV